MNNNIMLEAALSYARKGICVFPCKPRSKTPATQNGFKDATTDEEQIRRWWTENPKYNIGIPTGEVNRIWVLDVDGDEGYESYGKYKGEIDKNTPQVSTRKGMHLYFKYHEGLGTSAKRLPGLDVRADGGYVIAPPSVHESGMVYDWRGASRKPTEAPERLVKALRERPRSVGAVVEVDEVIP